MRASRITTIFIQTVKNKLFVVSVCAAIAMVLGALSVGAMKYVFKPVAATPNPIEMEPASLTTIQHQTESSMPADITPPTQQPSVSPVQVAQTPANIPATPLSKASHNVPALHDTVAVDITAPALDNPAHDAEPLLSLDSRILSLQVINPLPVGGLPLGVHIP